MINIIENERRYLDEILFLSKDNPFGCRIVSLFNTYNCNLPFVDFWIQFVNDKPASLISRLEDTFILCVTDASDIEEISSFIRISGAKTVLCSDKYELNCRMKKTTGPVLFNEKPFEITKQFEIYTPTTKDVYSIIYKAASENFNVPSYESFMLDVNHKLSQRSIRMFAIKEDKPVACIMTLAESRDSAVLGALATDPDCRRKGYGAFLIKYINNVLISEGKRVYLHRAPDENVSFYNKLGFMKYGSWAEYREYSYE